MALTLIVAYARERAIGWRNTIPWHVAGEQAHFKRLTLGHPIVMGRKTWESLPKRPLPGRTNVVVTHNRNYSAPGAQVVASLEDAIARFPDNTEVFIIGGASLYAQALPMATRIIATEIQLDVQADTHFPKLDASWQATHRIPGPRDSGQPPHEFVTYERKPR